MSSASTCSDYKGFKSLENALLYCHGVLLAFYVGIVLIQVKIRTKKAR